MGIGDKKLLRLINTYLKAGMMEGGLTDFPIHPKHRF
jgi:hypothetical protein